MKSCTKCGMTKSVNEFNKSRQNNDGLHSYCKSCKSEYQKKWRKVNRDARARYQKEYYKENKDARAKYKAEYYRKNKKDIQRKQKEYYKENKDAIYTGE